MASSWLATLGGVDRTTLVSNVRWGRVVNGIGTASFDVKDESGAYIPADDETVTFTVAGTVRWAGTIANPGGIRHLVHRGVGTMCSVTAQDNNQLLQRTVKNGIYPEGILKAALQELTGVGGVFTAQGITLDAGQADGPTLSVISSPWLTGEQLWLYLLTQAGYVGTVNASKVIKAWAIGSVSSGITLSIANANVRDAAYDISRYNYRSQQWVIYGPSQLLTVTDTWTGDGVTQEFAQHYRNGATKPDTVVEGATTHTVGVVGGVTTPVWNWRESDKVLVHTGAAVALDVAISSVYTSQFPNEVYVEDAGEAATRPWVRAEPKPEIENYYEARNWGLALIRDNLPRPKLPKIVTFVETIDPGATVVAHFPTIGLSSATCFVRGADTRVIPEGSQVILETTLDLIGGTEMPSGGPTELWKRIVFGGSSMGGGGSSGGGSGGAIVPSTSPSPVDYGGTMTQTAVDGTTTAQNMPEARDVPGDGRTWMVHAFTRSQFAAHTATPSVVRCSAAHVVEATVATGTGTNSTSSDPSTGNWQTLGPFVAESGKFYRLQVTMNNAAGAGSVMGIGQISA